MAGEIQLLKPITQDSVSISLSKAISPGRKVAMDANSGQLPADSDSDLSPEIAVQASGSPTQDSVTSVPAAAVSDPETSDGGDTEDSASEAGKGEQAAVRLLRCTEEQVGEVFHTPTGGSFARLSTNGSDENLPIRSPQFQNFLTGTFYDEYSQVPSKEALDGASRMFEFWATQGREIRLSVRVGSSGGKTYLDLCDSDRNQVQIDGDGWRLVKDAPVAFRRPKGMLPLPIPERGGSIDLLKEFINAEDDDNWVLMVAWLVGAFCSHGPYPILVVEGRHGTLKTSTCARLRAIVDPNAADLRAVPTTIQDLVIAAENSHVMAFDNLSRVPGDVSDAICRISTGAGFATRKLYTDSEEVIYRAVRPQLLNGIGDYLTREDVRSRSIIVTLDPLKGRDYRSERELDESFRRNAPKILGAVLDAVSAAMRNLDTIAVPQMPRMADFVRFIVAAEEALPWPNGRFLEAYQANMNAALDATLEGNLIYNAVEGLMTDYSQSWEGTASDLHLLLELKLDDDKRRMKEWPRSPRWLSTRLRELAPALEQKAGIFISFEKRDGRRVINIHRPNGTVITPNGAEVRDDLKK